MLVDATLLTKEEIQNEADERTTLALVIGEGESKRQRDLMSAKRQAWHARDMSSHLYREDRSKAVGNIRE